MFLELMSADSVERDRRRLRMVDASRRQRVLRLGLDQVDPDL